MLGWRSSWNVDVPSSIEFMLFLFIVGPHETRIQNMMMQWQLWFHKWRQNWVTLGWKE